MLKYVFGGFGLTSIGLGFQPYIESFQPYSLYFIWGGLLLFITPLILKCFQWLFKHRKKESNLASIDKLGEKNPEYNTAQGIDNIKSEFASRLSEDIAAIKSPENIQLDAYSILEKKFEKQHTIYIKLNNSLDSTDKDRFSKAWQAYYGEEDEQEWQLPDKYSVLLSNRLKNTNESTKQLAADRIGEILNLCH